MQAYLTNFLREGTAASNKNYISYRFSFADVLNEKMQRLESDTPEEIRILQHKEPTEFITLFGGRIVICKEDYINDNCLFHIRGPPDNIRATQVNRVRPLPVSRY